jgi:capsular exopolysaccharide synthesis family protein
LKRYLYLEASQKAKSKKKEQPKRQGTDHYAQDPKQTNACMTQSKPALNYEGVSAKSTGYSHQEQLMPSPKKAPVIVSPNSWYEFKNKLLSRNPQSPLRTLMFTGTGHGIGVTTAVINFSRAIARSTGRKVLIIDINLRTPHLHSVFNLNPADGVSELILNKEVKTCNFKKVGEGQLYAFTCGSNCSEGVNYFEPESFSKLLQKAVDKFDYVILDSAPISRFSDSQAICSLVDGTLLVIEAGKTRHQVALKAKKDLEDAGGNLLGIVLNKRKYYIPEWIYRRL